MPFRNGRPAHRLPRRRALILYPASAALVLTVGAGAWVWTGAQATDDGNNPPITIAGKGDKGGPVHVDTVALVRASVNAARNRQAIPSRTDPSIIKLRESVADVGECDYEQNVRKLCQVGEENGDKTLVLIGDSHARQWVPALDELAQRYGYTAYFLIREGCPSSDVTPWMVHGGPSTDCEAFQDWAREQVEELQPDVVLLGSEANRRGSYGSRSALSKSATAS
jgi:hypothetical protein